MTMFSIKYSNNIEKVDDFCFWRNRLFVLVEESIFYNDERIKVDMGRLYPLKNILFSSCDFYLDLNFELHYLKRLKGTYYTGIYKNSKFLFTDDRYFTIYDGTSDRIVMQRSHFNDRSVCLLMEYGFICNGGDFLSSHNMNSQDDNWLVHINNLLLVEESAIYANRLQIIDNKLFFFAHDSNWENYGTFCLDANTGEVLKRIEMAGFIYKHNDYIYVTNGKFITQINPDTFEIERIDLSGELKELDLIIDGERSFFFKDKLYFAAKPGDNTTRSVLGVLDLNSYKLLETYELLRDPSQPSCNENRYQIQDIKANDYQVAVNTAGDTLHVFEIKN